MQIQWVTEGGCLCVGVETPDSPGEDGAEGAVPLHPTAHVLGSLRPAGQLPHTLAVQHNTVDLYRPPGLVACATPPQGSRWTLQATTMNGDFVSIVFLSTFPTLTQSPTKSPVFKLLFLPPQGILIIQPDQMQVRLSFIVVDSLLFFLMEQIDKERISLPSLTRPSTLSWSWLWCPSWTVWSTRSSTSANSTSRESESVANDPLHRS